MGYLNLARAAVIRIGRSLVLELGKNAQLRVSDAVVETGPLLRVDGKPVGTIAVALAPINDVAEVEGEPIQIPRGARRSAELAIETLARLLAFEHRTGYSISSPMPYVGFTSQDEALLGSLVGKQIGQPVMCGIGPSASGESGFFQGEKLSGLTDRLDGVALLAVALCQENALGRYGQILRLFERAFATKTGRLMAPLVPFLTDGACPHGFTKKEIHAWIEARPKAAHADRRPDFLLEADARPWVGRMEEAGYDVLLNKLEWHASSSTRRNLWSPAAGSMDANAGIFITQGLAGSLSVQFLDGFEAYPLLLAGPLKGILPGGLWLEGDVDGGVLRRIDGPGTLSHVEEGA